MPSSTFSILSMVSSTDAAIIFTSSMLPITSTYSYATSSTSFSPYDNSTELRSSSTTTITVPVEPKTETEQVTVQSTSFVTHTITTTVPGIPAIMYTTKTSIFPNISAASVSEEWMTATGLRLSELLSLTSFVNDTPKSSEMNTTKSSFSIPVSRSLPGSNTATASSSSSSNKSVSSSVSSPLSDSSAMVLVTVTAPSNPPSATDLKGSTDSLNVFPATVSIITSILQSTSDTPATPVPPSLKSNSGATSPAAATTSVPITSMEVTSSSWTTTSVSSKASNAAIEFYPGCPSSKVDCATWKPTTSITDTPSTADTSTADVLDTAWRFSTDEPFDFRTINADSPSFRARPYSFDKRDTAWSALDARGYGMLVAWFVIGTVTGIACVLLGLRLWTWRSKQSLASSVHRPVRRQSYIWREDLGARRRGSTSPTHVSGSRSLGQNNLIGTRLVRRSWQEDSIV